MANRKTKAASGGKAPLEHAPRDAGGTGANAPICMSGAPIAPGTYSMKQTCELTGLAYETLKYYCKEGLVPNVGRDAANRRIFDERAIAWVRDLVCLRDCGLGIEEMRRYLALCLEGMPSVPERQAILAARRQSLLDRIAELRECVAYIDRKQALYEGFLSGEISYKSNLI